MSRFHGQLFADRLQYFLREVRLRHLPDDSMCIVDNDSGNPLNVVFFCNVGELGEFNHVGNDVVVCHRKPVCRANRTRAVWS